MTTDGRSHQKPGQVRKGPFLELSEEGGPHRHLDFRLLASELWTINACCFRHKSVVLGYESPRNLVTDGRHSWQREQDVQNRAET